MTTFSDVIEETMRRLTPAQLDLTVTLSIGVDDQPTSQNMSFSGAMTQAVAFGEILAIDMELVYVTAWDSLTLQATVERGAQGSTIAAHATNTNVYISPKFSHFDVSVAINQELQALSGAGLFQVATDDIVYNPTFQGYDLSNIGGLIDVIGVRYKIVTPTRNYPPIQRWSVLPFMTDTNFPSGTALIVYQSAYPGLPMHVWYSAAFTPLVNLTDDVVATSGLPATATDILSVGAQIILVNAREVKRNFMEAQPDPRKAPEVPPMAVANSIKGLELWRAGRISDERTRLANSLKYLRGSADDRTPSSCVLLT